MSHPAKTPVEIQRKRRSAYRRVFVAFLLLFSVPGFTGCAKEDARKIDLTQTVSIPETPKNPELRIGIIPEQNIHATVRRYEPLVEYLGWKMGMKVTVLYLDSYSEACDKFIYKQLDAAFIGSFNYALTHAKIGIEPLAHPEYAGVSVYRGLVLIRAGGGIDDVSKMKGRKLALVHQATFTGSLYPLHYFKENGIENFENYFSEVVYTGSHDKAIESLLNGETDVAIAKDQVYHRMIQENPALAERLTILSRSEPVPTNALCVRKELNPATKDRLKKLLCGLDKDISGAPVLKALNGVSRFVETRDEDYGRVYSMAKELDIDLLTYPYHERPSPGLAKNK